MAIKVTAGDLARDRARIIEAIGKWLTPQSDDRRYDWLYLNSPAGPARVWLAEDSRGSLIGLGAAFPRRIFSGGKEISGCVFGDFGVALEHRSAGLALQLQRACFESLEDGWAEVAYDFPSASMTAIYKRLGRGTALPFVRTAKPLRADRKIEAKIPVKPVAKVASRVANQVLALRDQRAAPGSGWTVVEREPNQKCGEEFTALARKTSGTSGTCVVRSAEYLNWRYLAHPTTRFHITEAWRGADLGGYLVSAHDGDQARIVDLFGLQEDTVFEVLLSNSLQRLRASGAQTVSAPVVIGSRQHTALKRQGFKDREAASALVFDSNAKAGEAQNNSANWFLMDGDRDS
jgi:hypothetical protein